MKPSTKEDVYLPYMPRPEVSNLSAEMLNKVAGGTVIPPEPEPETQDSTQVSQYTQVYQNVNYVENVDVAIEALVALVIISQADDARSIKQQKSRDGFSQKGIHAG